MRTSFTKNFIALIGTLTFLLTPSFLYPQVFVDINASGLNDGSSWENAYGNLSDALANTTSGEIWVAQGLYKTSSCDPCTDEDRLLAFAIPVGVQLYGGFQGIENEREQRDWGNNLTILSGDIGIEGDSTDNSYSIVRMINADEQTVLDGFIVENGNGEVSFANLNAGAISINASNSGQGDPHIRNCTLRNNYGIVGAGMIINCTAGGSSKAMITNCSFEDNTALRIGGSAVFITGDTGAEIATSFVNCTFRNNYSGDFGGAIHAAMANTLLRMKIDSCLFEGNRATESGGAIYYRMSSRGQSAVSINNSRFSNNTAEGQGGAIFCSSILNNIANDTISSCYFENNQATGLSDTENGAGGAVFVRGTENGAFNQYIVNSVFERNFAASRGGAVATTSSAAASGTCNVNIVNNTFYRNRTDGEGGAIHTDGSEGINNLTIFNSILWQDSAANSPNEVFNLGANITASFSNFDGGLPDRVNNGGGITDVDPQFGDPMNGDLRLTACSPLLDIGNNTAVQPLAQRDIDGAPRFFNGIVDLGAYEVRRIYVDSSAVDGQRTGLSWTDAYTDLQEALQIANSGDEIWIASGTYYPTNCISCTEADRQQSFNLVNNVRIYGGFMGTETALEERLPFAVFETILSGDIGIKEDSTDNSYHVVVAKNCSDKTLIDNISIVEGNADGELGFDRGGGLLIDASDNGIGDLTVVGCIFEESYAVKGGGVFIDCTSGGNANAYFRGGIIDNNTASLGAEGDGGGLCIVGDGGANISPRFGGTFFSRNYSSNDGGGIYVKANGVGTLLSIELDTSFITGNVSENRGGGIWYELSSGATSRMLFRNSLLIRNEAGGQGGGIYAYTGSNSVSLDTLIKCLVAANFSLGANENNNGEGGGLFLAGSENGIHNQQIIGSVLFLNYAAQRGGAIATSSAVNGNGTCRTTVINCTFTENRTDGNGGAIYAFGTEGLNEMGLFNTIFWIDTAEVAGAEVFSQDAGIRIFNSIIDGGVPEEIEDGGGNLDEDPQFINANREDFKLSACSPAINAGNNSFLPQDNFDLDGDNNQTEPISLDYFNVPRIFQDTVDIGAAEWNGTPVKLLYAVESTDASCGSNCDGQAVITSSAGVPPYEYSWSNGTTDPVIGNLCVGTHYFTITDAGGCIIMDSVTINQAVGFEISTSPDTAICPNETINLGVFVDGSGEDLTFSWDNGLGEGASQVVAPLQSTTYRVTVSDNFACEVVDSIFVDVAPTPAPVIDGNFSYCEGDATMLEVDSFANILWSTGAISRQITIDQAGEYSVSVRNEQGCLGSAQVLVTENERPVIDFVGNSSFCKDSSTQISITEDYEQYLWSGGETTATVTISTPGTYALTVTDDNNCTASDSITIAENIAVAPEISGDSSFCQGGSTTLNLNQFESYLWSTGDTTQQVVIDSVGEYAVTVVDINGCEGETSISISELATPMVSISGEPFICKNGTTTLSTSDLFDSYLWSTGETSINIEIETTGSYSITVVDEEGCQGTDSILVEERDSLQFMINGVESLCSGQTGLLDAGSFISYLWSNGSTSQSIEISSAGNYSVSVSDEFGCVGQSSILVEEGTVPQPSITGPSSICEGGTALLSTSVPYASYLWSGGSTNRTFVTSQSGLQTLEVMDENGCVGRDSITITFDAVIPELSLELDFLGTCTDSCVQIRASTNLTSDFTIRWSSLNNITFDLQSSTEALTCISDTYIVSVDNDITSCSFTDSIVVDVNGRFEEAFAGIDSSICTNSVVLSANAPDGSFGQWTSASNAIIDDPSNNRTSVSDLEEGIQTFIWTLSTAECPNYSQDEVSISVNSIPLAVDDQIQIRQDDARTVSLDVSQNDELTNVSEWEVVLIAPPSFGTIESFENGLLRYSVSDLSRGNTELTYQLCNLLCPDLCTEATVLIEVEPISLEEAEVPNAFTPNGDGVNEAFVFEILEVNSAETFPDNELIVFNRWGDIVFTQKGYDNSWTGLSNNGETLPDGTYYYILRLDIPNSIIIKGDVTIIR